MDRSPSVVASSLLFAILAGCGGESSTLPADSPDLIGVARRAVLDSVCVDQVNADRATLSLAPLQDWKDSIPCFSRQAALDQASGSAHSHMGMCTESAQNTCPGWTSDTSLSSQVRTIRSCVAMMWAEGPGSDYSAHGHYINMTRTGYRKVGCGFHQSADRIWIDMDLR